MSTSVFILGSGCIGILSGNLIYARSMNKENLVKGHLQMCGQGYRNEQGMIMYPGTRSSQILVRVFFCFLFFVTKYLRLDKHRKKGNGLFVVTLAES